MPWRSFSVSSRNDSLHPVTELADAKQLAHAQHTAGSPNPYVKNHNQAITNTQIEVCRVRNLLMVSMLLTHPENTIRMLVWSWQWREQLELQSFKEVGYWAGVTCGLLPWKECVGKPAQKSVTVELAHLTYMLPPLFWNRKDNSPSLGTERHVFRTERTSKGFTSEAATGLLDKGVRA